MRPSVFPTYSFRCRLQLCCRHLWSHCITGLQTPSFNKEFILLKSWKTSIKRLEEIYKENRDEKEDLEKEN